MFCSLCWTKVPESEQWYCLKLLLHNHGCDYGAMCVLIIRLSSSEVLCASLWQTTYMINVLVKLCVEILNMYRLHNPVRYTHRMVVFANWFAYIWLCNNRKMTSCCLVGELLHSQPIVAHPKGVFWLNELCNNRSGEIWNSSIGDCTST